MQNYFHTVTSELSQVEKKYLDPVWQGKMKLEEAGSKIAEEQNEILDKMNSK